MNLRLSGTATLNRSSGDAYIQRNSAEWKFEYEWPETDPSGETHQNDISRSNSLYPEHELYGNKPNV